MILLRPFPNVSLNNINRFSHLHYHSCIFKVFENALEKVLVGDAVGDAVGGQVGEVVGAVVGEAVGDAVGDAAGIWLFWKVLPEKKQKKENPRL